MIRSLSDWQKEALELCKWIDDNVFPQSDRGPTNISKAVDRMQALSHRSWCPDEFRIRAQELSGTGDVWDHEMRRTYRVLCDIVGYAAEDKSLLPRGTQTLETV